MKGLILAAGVGARLRPLTELAPKPLLPVLTRPNLDHVLAWMARLGIREVGINLHYKADQVRAFVGDGSAWGLKLELREETHLLQYGALARFDDFLGDEPVLVFNGDVVIEPDWQAFVRQHQERGSQATLMVVERPHPLQPVYWDEGGRLLGLRGSLPAVQVAVRTGTYTGVQILEAEARRWGVPQPVVTNMALQLYPRLLEGGLPLYVFVHRGYWSDIGMLSTYWQTHIELLQRPIPHYYRFLVPRGLGLWTGHEIHFADTSDWVPPVVVGAGVSVTEPAFLGPYAVIGSNAQVAAGAHVRNAIVWDGVSLAAGQRVEDLLLTMEGSYPLPRLADRGEANQPE